jgi:hypothetical protein
MVPPDAGTIKPPVVVPPDAASPPQVKQDAATPGNPNNPGACAFPKCVAALQAACMPAGNCVLQRVMGGGGIGSNVCYANGVKAFTSISGNGRGQNTTIRVMRADGTACYTIEPESRGGGVTGLNYRAPSGELIATGIVQNRTQLAIACTGTTAPQVVETSCQPGLVITGCSNGSCQ